MSSHFPLAVSSPPPPAATSFFPQQLLAREVMVPTPNGQCLQICLSRAHEALLPAHPWPVSAWMHFPGVTPILRPLPPMVQPLCARLSLTWGLAAVTTTTTPNQDCGLLGIGHCRTQIGPDGHIPACRSWGWGHTLSCLPGELVQESSFRESVQNVVWGLPRGLNQACPVHVAAALVCEEDTPVAPPPKIDFFFGSVG